MSSELIKTKVIGPVIIITAPSGSGKTTLVKYLLSQFPSLNFSISATTRTKRPKEEDGKDYHFVTTDIFQSFREQGLLVEWEEVYPNQFYGTLYSELTKIWERGNIVLFDVDVKGALALKSKFNTDVLSIFIKTPSLDILRERLKKRLTETEESLEKRISKAEQETSYANSFDIVLVNDVLEDAQQQIVDIINHFMTQLKHTWKHDATNL
ncbi:MAG: guanylate kinase [Saprospiraceae bacterium]|jgi:guanylate kinase|nr:guanylate kinase [Saprospiraceae bacterium]